MLRIPSNPIAIPSQGATVQNSKGTPPASIIPYFTASARILKCLWPGLISFQVLTTAMNGLLSISSSSKPNPFNNANFPNLIGVFSIPSKILLLLFFKSTSSLVIFYQTFSNNYIYAI